MEKTHKKRFQRRSFTKSKLPSVKWFKQWVQHDVATGGKCSVLKWVNEAELNSMKEKAKERELVEPEATTEILLLCSFAGCGKTFVDAEDLRKHSQIHVESQHVCRYHNCGKKFRDSSKLKKHYVGHTSEKDFVCPLEGCGNAYSLELDLWSHMKTHSEENCHICLYPECGKNHDHEYTLKNDITSHHDKPRAQNAADASPRYTLVGKPVQAPTNFPIVYCCPYKGCKKTYTQLGNLHRHFCRQHPEHFTNKNPIITQPCNNNNTGNEMAESSNHNGYAGNTNVQKLNMLMPNLKLQPYNVLQQNYAVTENEMAEESNHNGYAGNTNVQRVNMPMPNLTLQQYNVLQQKYAVASSMVPPWPVTDVMPAHQVDYEEQKRNEMMWDWDGLWRYE